MSKPSIVFSIIASIKKANPTPIIAIYNIGKSSMTQNIHKKVLVKNSRIHGKGLFAGQAIKKGDVIGVCQTKPTKRIGEHTLWLAGGKKVDVICDLKYINHSKKPNVIYYDDLQVVALKNIRNGAELVHDYGDEWD